MEAFLAYRYMLLDLMTYASLIGVHHGSGTEGSVQHVVNIASNNTIYRLLYTEPIHTEEFRPMERDRTAAHELYTML